jgi:serine/threonine protein kinase
VDESRCKLEGILNIILKLITIICTGFIIIINIFSLFYLIIKLILKDLTGLTKKKDPKFCSKCQVHLYNPTSDIEIERNFKLHQINWIPFEQLKNTEFITNGGFSRIFKAVWNDNKPRLVMENETKSRILIRGSVVVVKYILNPSNIFNEFHAHILCIKSNSVIPLLGVSKDINTNEFVLVMRLAQKGNLRQYLNDEPNLSWKKKMGLILDITTGLADIHKAGLIHADFHSGNILISAGGKALISDLGLSRLSKSSTSYPEMDELYGVMPYIAPEVIRKKTGYTQEADVYSFGIVLCEVCSGLQPYYGHVLDVFLIIDICKELRPVINPETPKFLVSLMKSCWHDDRLKRPSMNLVFKDVCDFYINSEIQEETLTIREENITIGKDHKQNLNCVIINYSIPFQSINFFSSLQYDNVSNYD